ncbi:MAG: hypothetical protein ACP5I6_02415 [Caldisphaera sp.]|nr:hypothetical protein [Caldisphaera sp.]PMP89229.1 MAG: hypothetical protein C0172_00635 [Caldisphaera sp.]
MKRAEKILNGYSDIVEPVLKYPRHRELESSMEILPEICENYFCSKLCELYQKINNKKICIIGPGKINNVHLNNCKLIAGPEGGLINTLSLGLKMLFVTTDLDSSQKLVNSIYYLSNIRFIHVHGDNLTRLKLQKFFDENTIFTTQVLTPYCALPVGSFTDGDRAIAISMLFNASRIYIYGFNFNESLCLHKDYCYSDYKKTKLFLSKKILLYISKTLKYKIKEDKKNGIFYIKSID